MKKIVSKGIVFGIMTSLFLAGCGGGGSSPVLTSADSSKSGAVAKVSTSGVTLDNVDYSTNDATVTINGEPASFSELKTGMTVTITGSVEGAKGKAIRIEREGELEGRVSAVDPAAGRFIVMGQTVVVSAATTYDGLSGIGALNVGAEVEVDGNTNAAGVIEATRLELKSANDINKRFIAGVIKGLDSAARSFTIWNVTVTYGTAIVPTLPLADGQAVLVRGALKDGLFIATKIMLSGSGAPHPTPNPTPTPLDGAALYGANCAGCHNLLATSAKKGRSAAQIQAAITANRGGMGSITLTTAEIQAIATALAAPVVTPTPTPVVTPVAITTASLAAATTGSGYSQSLTATGGASPYSWSITAGVLPPGLLLTGGTISGTPTTAGSYSFTVQAVDSATSKATASKSFSILVSAATPLIDGAALYSTNCAGCHGLLATSSKRTRSAAQIQSAISGNRGGMGSITLTPAEIAAIATALK